MPEMNTHSPQSKSSILLPPSDQVKFLGRADELSQILKYVQQPGGLHVICLHGCGGIGKTRLLQEIHQRFQPEGQWEQFSEQVLPTEILDFDNQHLLIPENLLDRLAAKLSTRHFESFFVEQVEYFEHLHQVSGMSANRLEQEYTALHETFVTCFNSFSRQHKILLFLDTTDHLDRYRRVWTTLTQIIPRLKNLTIFMAGRNMQELGGILQKNMGEKVVVFELPPLSDEESLQYLEQRQEQKLILLEDDLAQKLITLAHGRPIFIDLAVEWSTQGISLDWLIDSEPNMLTSLNSTQQADFEESLVAHLKNMRTPADKLVLLMSYIYPMNAEILAEIFKDIDSETLLNQVKDYVFIKQLPSGSLSLHDEMRRMIDEYVWPEVDQGYKRRAWYSSYYLEYLSRQKTVLDQEMSEQKSRLATTKHNELSVPELLELSLRLEQLEQELWRIKELEVEHTIVTDVEKGVRLFTNVFSEATKASRFSLKPRLFSSLQKYEHKLSTQQLFIKDVHQIKLLMDESEYYGAKAVAEKILSQEPLAAEQLFKNIQYIKQALDDGRYDEARRLARESLMQDHLSVEQQIEVLLLLGNIKVRLKEEQGSSTEKPHPRKALEEAREDFQHVVDISMRSSTPFWQIRALNALGWVNRLLGNLDLAKRYYLEARRLCLQENGLEKNEFRDQYGWISNNLVYVLSSNRGTIRTAINIAQVNVEHWESIGNDLGLGACYIVLGVAYYRNDNYNDALYYLEKAHEIFEPLGLDDWLGQIYAWRGTLYRDQEKFEIAQQDLEKALEIGPPQVQAMTLYWLGRIHMSRQEWEPAQGKMMDALSKAKELPDYQYWLAAIARLTAIACEQERYELREKLTLELQICLEMHKQPEENSLGMAQIGLAKMALMQHDVETFFDLLTAGIEKITHSSYSHADILGQLRFLEKDFHRFDPAMIQKIGHMLTEHVLEKETTSETIDYSAITPIIYSWAKWAGGKEQHE